MVDLDLFVEANSKILELKLGCCCCYRWQTFSVVDTRLELAAAFFWQTFWWTSSIIGQTYTIIYFSVIMKPKNPYFTPLIFKRNGSSATSIISSSPRKYCGQTMHFKVTAENVNLDGEVCKSLASLCIEEAESRLCSKMASEFYLFVKEKDRKSVV